jgi:hypothetical protein
LDGLRQCQGFFLGFGLACLMGFGGGGGGGATLTAVAVQVADFQQEKDIPSDLQDN